MLVSDLAAETTVDSEENALLVFFGGGVLKSSVTLEFASPSSTDGIPMVNIISEGFTFE